MTNKTNSHQQGHYPAPNFSLSSNLLHLFVSSLSPLRVWTEAVEQSRHWSWVK